MRTILGWWCLFLAYAYVAQKTHTHYMLCYHASDDIACRKLMSVSRCAQIMKDVWRRWLCVPAIGWCHLDEACRPWLNSPSRCTHATANAHMPWLILLAVRRYLLTTTPRTGFMSISWYTHDMTSACTPLMLLPLVCQWHRPWVMS